MFYTSGTTGRPKGILRHAFTPQQAAANVSNLSELQLTLGDVAQAVESGARSSSYADQSGAGHLSIPFRAVIDRAGARANNRRVSEILCPDRAAVRQISALLVTPSREDQ